MKILPECFKVRRLSAVLYDNRSPASEKSCTHASRRVKSNAVGPLDNGGEIDNEEENLEGKLS